MITVIGYDGSPLSGRAAERLAAARVVAGGPRVLASVGVPSGARVVELHGDVAGALAELRDEPAVVLASGDPGFFGILRAVRAAREDAPIEVLPAVSSVAAAFGRAGLRWDDAVVVSAHGRPLGPVVAACRARPKVAVLTAPGAGPAELGEALAGADRVLLVASRLGEPDEDVATVSPDQAAARCWPEPNVVLVVDPDAVDGGKGWLAGGEHVPDGWALPEDAFAHRDSMITKSEVRALVLARLAPRLGTVVWDVGAGSGSVAVECARFGADVVAIERDREACEAIAANARAHGVGVDVVEGAAPAALDGLRPADAVFVGGGGPGVLARALELAMPRRAVVAVAAVERVGPTLDVLAAAGYATGGALLQSAQLRRLPDGGHRLAARNPVHVLWGERP